MRSLLLSAVVGGASILIFAIPSTAHQSTISRNLEKLLEPKVLEITGHFWGGFEQNEFRRCLGLPNEFTVANPEAISKFSRRHPGKPLMIVGRATAEGAHGRFGTYKHLLVVDSVTVASHRSKPCPKD